MRATLGLLGTLSVLWPLVAFPGSGRLEINQACAIQTGCLAADAPGFPVDIMQPGSYVLTSDLQHDPAVDGSTEIVRLLADDVTIDLNGFAIRSTSSCLSGACDIGTVDGIDSSTADRVTVRGGQITGVDGNCLRLASQAHVQGVAVSHCGNLGISVGANSIVENCRVTSTGRTGLHSSAFAQPSGTLYRDCVFARNGLRDEDILPDITASVSRQVRSSGPNICEDGLCASGERRYYLTISEYDGTQPLGACEPGFHFASFAEILSVSHLRYDTRRGRNREDSGSGAPIAVAGWIRSGSDDDADGNCHSWSSLGFPTPHLGRSAAVGSTGQLFIGFRECGDPLAVWCIED